MHPLARMSALAPIIATVLTLACGSDGATGPGPGGGATPAKTPVGTPIGSPVTQTIGPAGGTLATTDGFLSVTIPAGALAADAVIGIQALSTEAPGAVSAYRLTPEGTTFAEPVSLVFALSIDHLQGSAPQLLTIASQQADGSWLLAHPVTLDPIAGTLTASTTHFSDWTMLQGFQIRPPSGKLKPGESIGLTVTDCTTIVETSTGTHSAYVIDCEDAPTTSPPGEDDLPALPRFSVDASSWAVNGTQGGSATYGFAAGERATAVYAAPSTAPTSGNPVAVSVRVRDAGNHTVSTLVANIEIELVCAAPGTARLPSIADTCAEEWAGTSSTTIDDAFPLYQLEATVTWKYDPLLSLPGKPHYVAEGTATFTVLDACISVTPSTYTWVAGDDGAEGSLDIDFTLEHPTYEGHGITLWTATYTDLCDEEHPTFTVGAGGAWFLAEGVLENAEATTIGGTYTGSGQTFDYSFTRVGTGGVRAARAVGRRR